jgi:hypothetical protein
MNAAALGTVEKYSAPPENLAVPPPDLFSVGFGNA